MRILFIGNVLLSYNLLKVAIKNKTIILGVITKKNQSLILIMQILQVYVIKAYWFDGFQSLDFPPKELDCISTRNN